MQAILLAVLAAFPAAAFLPMQNPRWEPTYNMSLSTLSMFMNFSGWTDPELASQFGISSFDWSNAKAQWAKQKPMDCEERLVTQAVNTKKLNPQSHVFVYRNLVKALPWYTSVRVKLDDPAYSGFFLRFKPGGFFPNGSYHVPQCTYEKCSIFYHDQEQTPEKPTPEDPNPDGKCLDECDCGKNPCGEYLWDHRNGTMLRNFLIKEFIMGPTGLGHPDIDGLFIDDFWCSNLMNSSCTDPVQGPTEEDRYSQLDMGLSDQDIKHLTEEWLVTFTQAQQAIVDAKKYTWSLIPNQQNANAAPVTIHHANCVELMRSAPRYQELPLLFGLNETAGKFPYLQQEIAAFLLMRGPYAWIGKGTWGMVWDSKVARPKELDTNYGKPLNMASEQGPGVFRREYEHATVTLNCINFAGIIHMK